MVELDTNIVNTVSDLIELAVAPVFLLAGVAGLLNVFTGRLSRIIHKVERFDAIQERMKEENQNYKPNSEEVKRRSFLNMRMENTNLAIFFCTTTGLLISLVIVTMFLSAMFKFKGAIFISMLFIFAMISLILSLVVFLKEIFYTTAFIRSKKS